MRKNTLKRGNKPAIILTTILVIFVGFVAVWGYLNFDAIKSTFDGTKLYTQDEVTEAYNKGLTDRRSYETQINGWIAKYEAEVNKLATAREQIQALNASITESNQSRAEMQAQINELSVAIAEAESNLNYYMQVLAKYQSMTQAVVAFIVDGEIYGELVAVEKGEKLTELPSTSAIENMEFEGWSLDGETIINPLDVTINEDTRFIAVGEVIKYTVTFVDNKGNTIELQSVKKGHFATNPNNTEKEYYKLKCWSVNGSEVDISS